MRGSEFLAANSGKSLSQWEANALAQTDSFVNWPMVPVNVASSDGKHTGRFYVSSDYFSIGAPDDYFRLPLTPITAQRIANLRGFLLPTSKMVEEIWRASGHKLLPQPLVPNKGANLSQYAEHSKIIDSSLSSDLAPPQVVPAGQANLSLISGHKKDVIISNIWKPGKVVIYGWFRPDGSHIQPKTNVHGDFYVDYSHGIRFVNPVMEVDGQQIHVEDVLKSKEYSSMVSDEGTINRVRYPTGTGAQEIAAATSSTGKLSYYKLGSSVLLTLANYNNVLAGVKI